MHAPRRRAVRYRRVLMILLLAAGLAGSGCAPLRFAGSVVGARLDQVPSRELDVARVEARRIPGPESEIPVQVYTPHGPGPFPVLMYFHGGGWSTGSPATHERACRFLSSRTPCVVVSVAYRLAPRHTFPAAFDDACAATLWAYAKHDRLQADPGRLAVAGDSAGGNLAAAVALAARDRGGPPIALQVLAFPATDLANLDTASYIDNDHGAYLTKAMLEGFRDRYLRGPDDRRNPYASPLLAPDHRGLPPALIIVGERDVLRDDGLLYGAALAAQGVPVDVLRLAGQGHAVAPWALAAEQAREPLEAAVQALRAVFYGGDVAPDM